VKLDVDGAFKPDEELEEPGADVDGKFGKLKEAAKAPTQSGVSSLFIALKSITD
jgi:hypothetical protein